MKHVILAVVLVFVLVTTTPVSADGVVTGGGTNTGAGNPSGGKNQTPYWPDRSQTIRSQVSRGAFSGTWYAFTANTAFTLVLEQDGSNIKGAHCAIYDYGRKIDSSNGTVSIVGKIEGGVAFVEWKSGLSPEMGKATLELVEGRPDTLNWIIAEPPKNADPQKTEETKTSESYFPRSAFLIKK